MRNRWMVWGGAGLLAGVLGCASVGAGPESAGVNGPVVASTTPLRALDGSATTLAAGAGREATVLAFFATW